MLVRQRQWTSREVSVGGVSGRGGKGWNPCLLLERIGRDQSCPEWLGARLLAARRGLVRERDQSSSELVDDRSLNSKAETADSQSGRRAWFFLRQSSQTP